MPMIMAIEHSGIAITVDAIKMKLLDMEGDSTNAGKEGSAFYLKKSCRQFGGVGSNGEKNLFEVTRVCDQLMTRKK